MPILKAKLKKEKGFISIVALGIFALLSIFGIIIQQTVVDTFQSVKNTNNYYSARDIADSVMEMLQFELNKHDVGFNTEENGETSIHCEFVNGSTDSSNSFCSQIIDLLDVRPVTVDLEIKGRPEDNEKLATTKCLSGTNLSENINDSCYSVPFPGTGDAGERCNMYIPEFGVAGSTKIPANIITGGNPANNEYGDVDQLNYPCNWNKLTFGSSLTDRVAIPLYYDDGSEIKNPFNTQPGGGGTSATKLVLRIRPPCLPCYKTAQGGAQPSDTRSCESGQDENVCPDNQRYQLNTDENDIIVQWNLTGICENSSGTKEECGLISDPNELDSTINEERVNDSSSAYNVLGNESIGIVTNVHPQIGGTFITDTVDLSGQLPKYEKAILNLYLNEALISTNNKNIPYLEYQVFTDRPIANPKTKIHVTVNVDGNVFTKTLSKENQKSIIDFAIQN